MAGRGVSALAMAVLAGLAVALLSAAPATAQQRGVGGFFQRLFAPSQPQYEPAAPPARVGRPPANSGRTQGSNRPRRSTPAEPAVPVVVELPKAADAATVLVVGDFFAAALANGLEQAFAEDPGVLIVTRTDGSSGLVRDDHYDWNTELPGILNEVNPDRVVVMIGVNDRQPVTTDTGRLAVRSPEWEAAYDARVAALADTLKVYGRPFYWVGEPPLRSSSASTDMAYLNTVFKAAVERVGGHFVDIWNGFADEQGRYASRAPYIDGQVRTVRASDGINFTRAGSRKLAYFVERELRQEGLTGGAGAALATSSSPASNIEVGPDGEKRLVGPIISLSGPPPGASLDLAGAVASPAPAADTPQYRLVFAGEPPPAPPGRADDYTWPPPDVPLPVPPPAADTTASDTTASDTTGSDTTGSVVTPGD